jgi:hypothetical protein
MARGRIAHDLGWDALEAQMRSFVALGLLSLAIFLSSCSYLLGGTFPAYDQRIEAMTDFDSAVKAASGGSGILYINRLDYLGSVNASGLLVQLTTKDGTPRLLALDGNSLGDPVGYTFTAATPFGLGYPSGLDASGDYVSGHLALTRYFRLSAPSVPDSVPLNSILLSEGGINYCFSVANSVSSLSAQTYDAAWAPVSTKSIPISAAGSWGLRSAAQGGGYYSFLFYRSDTNSFRAFRSPSIASMPWASLFDDASVSADCKTAEFSADQSMVWITADGPVTVSHGNGTSFNLLGFGAAASNSSYALKDSSSLQVSFEGSGYYWFLYEATTGQLYKLRTWWK